MEYAKEIVGLLAALVGLVAAIFTYYATKRRPILSSSKSRVRLSRMSSEPVKKWRWRVLQGIVVLVGSICLIAFLISVLFWMKGNPRIPLWVAMELGVLSAAYGYAFWKVVRRKPWETHSVVRRKTEVEVEADYGTLFAHCETALKIIGARITALNKVNGVLEARTGINWRSWGAKMRIQILPVREATHIIKIESDSILPTILLDFGNNKRNVRRFIEALVA